MAIDTEAKRWSMLQVANGFGYSHLINPTGSNFDSQVERLTLLNIYGASLAADTTAPVLSLPTGTKTGSTTATGTVSTDEGNGTLYFWATENATETAAAIKASGDSQAVVATGVQNVSFTGLTAGTTHYAHYVHDDAASNESNVVTSTTFDTDAAVSDKTFTGGFYVEMELYRRRQEKERREREEKRRKAKQIKDELERKIALEQRRIEEEEARHIELAELTSIVEQNEKILRHATNERIAFIAKEAINRHTYSKMERLERELNLYLEEEEFLMMATQIILNQ